MEEKLLQKKKRGRPRIVYDYEKIVGFKEAKLSYRQIEKKTGISKSMVGIILKRKW